MPFKCLIVDDLPENLLALSALLERDGVEVLCARSGTAALELLLVHDVALALLDVNMPEMSGFELAELMRGSDRTREIPIIFVTAAASDSSRVFRGYDTGAVDFLHKPIEPRVLNGKVAVFLELFRQRQELADRLAVTAETLRLNELFVAAVGHDLRSPLGAILNSARLIERQTSEESLRRCAQTITSSGARMQAMISDLLDLARTRLGAGISLQREALMLQDIASAVARECSAAYPGRRIEVENESGVSVKADKTRLSQAIANLLTNALQHSSTESTVTLRVSQSAAGEGVLEITNAGEIPSAARGRLFDPFYRGTDSHTTDGQQDGLGLGLFIVSQIAEAHGGTVDAYSGDGMTTFRLTLPRDG